MENENFVAFEYGLGKKYNDLVRKGVEVQTILFTWRIFTSLFANKSKSWSILVEKFWKNTDNVNVSPLCMV